MFSKYMDKYVILLVIILSNQQSLNFQLFIHYFLFQLQDTMIVILLILIRKTDALQ